MPPSKEAMEKNVLQAVVIADHFANDFDPITDNIPFMFLRVCNFPMIEYIIQVLFYSDVKEVFFVCNSHVEVIEDYIKMCYDRIINWTVEIQVHVIRSDSSSLGDCLRHLHSNDLIRGNFILMEPGSMCNIKLNHVMKIHEETCKKDRSATMTLIFQRAPLEALQEKLMVIQSSSTKKLLFYHQNSKSDPAKVPGEIFIENDGVDILEDFRDTRISICSPNVLSLFADNFDFQTRDDFVKNLLANEEISDGTVYCHQGGDKEWGACIRNWRSYQHVSFDIIKGWSYPLVPTNMHRAEFLGIKYKTISLSNIIIHNKRSVAKSASFKEKVILGENSSIQDEARVTCSVIGDNVIIGKNVFIEDSFIFPNAVVHDNSKVICGVIGSNSVVNSNSSIINASIIGDKVELPSGTVIDNELVTSAEAEKYETIRQVGSSAFVVKCVEEDDESNIKSRLKLKDEVSSSEDEFLDEFDEGFDKSDSDESDVEEESNTNVFFKEVLDSLARGFEEKLQWNNLILEINSSRYVYNVSNEEVNSNVVKAILTLPFQLQAGQSYWPFVQQLLEYFLQILRNYIKNSSSMLDCLRAIEDMNVEHKEVTGVVCKILMYLYNKDVLSEEVIIQWFEDLDSGSELRLKVEPFITWLQEAEEESSDEES